MRVARRNRRDAAIQNTKYAARRRGIEVLSYDPTAPVLHVVTLCPAAVRPLTISLMCVALACPERIGSAEMNKMFIRSIRNRDCKKWCYWARMASGRKQVM